MEDRTEDFSGIPLSPSLGRSLTFNAGKVE
jgi:hypothetical protein